MKRPGRSLLRRTLVTVAVIIAVYMVGNGLAVVVSKDAGTAGTVSRAQIVMRISEEAKESANSKVRHIECHEGGSTTTWRCSLDFVDGRRAVANVRVRGENVESSELRIRPK